MALEIERKFLLASEEWRSDVETSVQMVQGYFELLSSSQPPTVRVRIAGEKAFLTMKGPLRRISRSEFEYEIPVADAKAMLREFCGSRVVEKTRHFVPYGGFVWEIDEYSGENAGLFTAEIELDREGALFPTPPWLGPEISSDRRYRNGALSRKPYRRWKGSSKRTS